MKIHYVMPMAGRGSRFSNKGDTYLPLRGENFDGHNFISKALENGAIGYFTQDKFIIN